MFLFLFEKSSKVINFLFSYLDFSSMFFSCFHLWEYLFIFAMIDVIWYYQNEGNSCFYPSSICVSVILCLHFGTFLFSTIFSHYSYHHISQVAVFCFNAFAITLSTRVLLIIFILFDVVDSL